MRKFLFEGKISSNFLQNLKNHPFGFLLSWCDCSQMVFFYRMYVKILCPAKNLVDFRSSLNPISILLQGKEPLRNACEIKVYKRLMGKHQSKFLSCIPPLFLPLTLASVAPGRGVCVLEYWLRATCFDRHAAPFDFTPRRGTRGMRWPIWIIAAGAHSHIRALEPRKNCCLSGSRDDSRAINLSRRFRSCLFSLCFVYIQVECRALKANNSRQT
jgi:hypothetical protein